MYAIIKQFRKFTLFSKNGDRLTDGEIIFKEDNKISVELESTENWRRDRLYDLVFQVNRVYHLLQHQALDFVLQHKLFDLLIDNPNYSAPESHDNQIDYVPPKVIDFGLNEEQKNALTNIVSGKYYPLPYLLYGPAGTGKTRTLAATISQIVSTTRENILVCAQSNSACDEIAVRLKEYLDESEMFRMYTKSKDLSELTESIIEFSNYFDGELKFPPLRYIRKYRVVICTLATAGCLTRAQCNPKHFTYVFIDECASSVEPITLVPIAGLCTTLGKVHAKIILAGDPKQLDAVTISPWTEKLGFSKSLLEHLFNFALYKRDTISGRFNSKYITQLVKNYRSHPAILEIPNALFYDGSLEAKSMPQIADLNVSLPDLKPSFPIIFKSVQGTCIKPDDDTRYECTF